MPDCAFTIVESPAGWLYCGNCKRYQQGRSLLVRRMCRPELRTLKDKPTADAPMLGKSPADGGVSSAGGAGTELLCLLAKIGVTSGVIGGCRCNQKAARMDAKGVEWCRANRERIATWLKRQARKRGWTEKAAVGVRAILDGAISIRQIRRPFLALVNEAIRLAELKELNLMAAPT